MGDWRRAVARFLEFPEDLFLNQPRLIIFGGGRLVVENHRGLVEYDGERILVARPQGFIEVRGTDLEVRRLDGEELEITGGIGSVSLNHS